jgi:acyl-coenzyme A synthetase/AMP-(fatty) acid ligase
VSPVLDADVRRGVPLAQNLRRFGDAPALLTSDRVLTYADLADLVDEAAAHHRAERRLVLIAVHNAVEPIVEYLAALATGNPVLLVPDANPDHVAGWIDRYDPDVVVREAKNGAWAVDERRAISTHVLHPDLALLLTTSGSTGSSKLVRLSNENVQANADQIADALGLRNSDRAVLSLPLSYSYGLSVLHSHLTIGAAIAVTDLSVVDPCFWDLVTQHEITTLPGVPYTFALLDHNGFADRDVPSLRLVTQAGGRMDPADVRRFAELGTRKGWELRVMYGQTEATARIAVGEARDVHDNPASVGRPLTGSSVHLAADGELVVSGPQVMLGYATSPQDLADGRTITALRTGDLARIDAQGRLEITGRRGRFAKVFGLRLDLDGVESALQRRGIEAAAVPLNDRLGIVAVGPVRKRRDAALTVQRATGLPSAALQLVMVDAMPRTIAGKRDGAALVERLEEERTRNSRIEQAALATTQATTDDLCAMFARRLGHPHVTPNDSFVTLGGDSLSYVEMSVALEQILGNLPQNWQHRSIGELVATATATPTTAHATRWWRAVRLRTVDSTIVMRALAIIAVVGSHVPVFNHRGGAHLLLAVAGYNIARFQLTDVARRQRVRGLLDAIGRVAIPSIVWISIVVALVQEYALPSALLMNTVVGGSDWSPGWRYWFVETLVYLLVGLTLLAAIPAIDRLDRRWPFGLPMALVAVGLITRYGILGNPTGPMHAFTPAFVIWLFALGWAAQRATTIQHRAMVSAAALLTVPGFSTNSERVTLVLIGVLILVWLPTMRVPHLLVKPSAILAAASLWIYLSHWQTLAVMDGMNGWVVVATSLLVGIGLHAVWESGARRVRVWRRASHPGTFTSVGSDAGRRPTAPQSAA